MKITFTALPVVVFIFTSCGQENIEPTAEDIIEVAGSDTKILSLEELRGGQRDYLDREITLAAYLFTHEEGAWVGDYPDRPLVNYMSLRIGEDSELVSASLSRFRWWFEYQEGYPIILTGIYRIGDWKKHGHTIKNYPFIEVTRAVEVGIDEPDWKQAKKRANKAEMATPRKPSD